MEIRRNTPRGTSPQTPKIDLTRPNREGIERAVEVSQAEAAELAKAADEAERPSPTSTAKASSERTPPGNADLALAVADRLGAVRENAIAERIRDGRSDQVELSDAATKMTADFEHREQRVRDLRRDYLGGRLVTNARLDQAAEGILSQPS